MRAVVGDLVDPSSGQGECELVADVCEPYPIPIICELLGAPPRGLEALLGLGHRHLPHLQRQPGRGPAAHRAGGRRAHRLRERHDRRAPRRPPRRPPERPDRHRGGGRPALDRRDDDAGRGRAHGRDRHHPQPAGLLGGPLQRAPRPVGAAGRASPSWPARAVEESMRYLGAVRGTARFASEDDRLPRRAVPPGHPGDHLAGRRQPRPGGLGRARRLRHHARARSRRR